MAGTGSLFSQTLQDITTTKLEELSRQRNAFENHRLRAQSLERGDANNFRAISKTVITAFGLTVADDKVVQGGTEHNVLETDLINLDRILAQASYDPSFSTKLLQQWQDKLLRHVDNQSMRYTFAWLYGQLTMEWLSAKASPLPTARKEDSGDSEDFEHVSAAKKIQSRDRWEQSVFTPANVDREAVSSFLQGLFKPSEDDAQALPDALKDLRNKVSSFETQITRPGQFDIYTLRWTIKGLLSSDLLTEDKKAALRDFQTNDTILREIADVLNMRLSALKDWSWGTEVIVEERRQLNGSYNIFMHEDLLQAIFLQQIGVRWSVFFKNTFRDFQKQKDVWNPAGNTMTTLDKKRREYFLVNRQRTDDTVAILKRKRYRQSYFVSQLLTSEFQETNDEEGNEEADFEMPAVSAAFSSVSAPKKKMASMAARKSAPQPDEDLEEEDEDMGFGLFDFDDDDQPATQRNPMALKQEILHLLATDILIQTRLKGECSCFRSQIDSLVPSLPHDTIRTVMEHFGISQKWLQFFTRFLEAPLRFADDDSSQPRTRRNGAPGSHVLSETFAEVILFCLDLSINQEAAGEYLWRVHDDLWFWSDNNQTTLDAWSTTQKFTSTMGLKLNKTRTGAVRIQRALNTEHGVKSVSVGSALPQGQIRWGMLYLNPDSGRFEIDQRMVDEHITELQRQLESKGDSVFAWIQVWNSYASTFFTSNFGKPANCFGRQHIDNILATHQRIQSQVFSAGSGGNHQNLIDHLKQVIGDRHGIRDLPDGYFFFPTDLGGLEIRSPFVSLLQIRDAVIGDFGKLFIDLEKGEKEEYRKLKQAFEDFKATGRRRGGMDPDFEPEDSETFFSFEEFTKYREEASLGAHNQLVSVYNELLEEPRQESLLGPDGGEVESALQRLTHESTKLSGWWQMEPYWRWVAQLYGPEIIAKFGGLKIVDAGLLPMGMVGLFRSGRVKWQE